MASMPGARTAPAGAPAGAAPEKKGEVNELRQLLRGVNAERDSKRKRDVLKKVIAYMTLGIDVSRLFSEMIMASNTKDLVIKKMVYAYLCAHAQSNPEITLLAINTLQKDCRDEDPMIRGLALRSLTSLRLLSILEYVMAPLKACLNDSSSYVRQAAVIGVLKVYHLSPSTVAEHDFQDVLFNMMRDRDPQVVINCVMTLNEMKASEGGIPVSQPMLVYLIGRLREFNDWGQSIVIDLLTKYTPADEDELFGIMNLLDPFLRVANSAVVLAATKCFIHLTTPMPDIQMQVFMRLKTPMLTLMTSQSPEVAYAVLAHVAAIIHRAPGVFDDDFKQFFCKYNEPSYSKTVKMGLLPAIANPSNAREIVAELTEYVSGVDAELARQAVRAIGDIAVRVPAAAETVGESLLELIEMDAEYVRAETVVAMQDLLRKYPERAHSIIPSLHRCLKRMEDATGKAAVVWMIGEYGHLIDDAPYVLEPLIDAVKDEESTAVRMELLTATVKLFFKRPPEVQKMMGRLLKFCLSETVPPVLHDRALLYFRLLRANVKEAAAIIGGEKPPVTEFHNEQSADVKAKIFSEFNSLAVLYDKPSETFIAPDHLVAAPPIDAVKPGTGPAVRAVTAVAADSEDGLLGGMDAAMPSAEVAAVAAAPAPSAPAPAPAYSFDDDLLGLGGFSSPAPAPAPAAPAVVALIPGATLDPTAYQSKWTALPVAQTVNLAASRLPATAEVDALARAGNVFTIASGDVGTALKFFFFGRDSTGAYHLFEVMLDKTNGAITATVKSEAPAQLPAAVAGLTAALRPILR